MRDTDDAAPTGVTGVATRRFGDGLAVGPDLVGAAEVAVAQALAPLDGIRPDLLVFFVCPGGDGDLEQAERAGARVMELAGARAAVGATAHGVIGDGRGVEQTASVAVWAATLPGTSITPMRLTAQAAEDGTLSVRGMSTPGADATVAMLLADPYSFPVGGLLERMNTAHPGFPLVGGLASAPGGPGGNRLFADGEVLPTGAVGILFGGQAQARTVVSQGCRPIGPPMVVTRTEQNLLLELAGRPALARLREIVGALPAAEQKLALRGLHLGIAMDEYADDHGRGDFLIRAVLGVEQERDAVVVGDVLEVGQTVRFQVRDAAGAEQNLTELLARAVRSGPAQGALLFSCNGRGASMFGPESGGADHDVRVVRASNPDQAVAGFFAAGEIGPVGGRNHLHGFTASVLVFD
ncbi:small ligand-binding sensory domain FIST [Pseudonocardia sediminis]|uniref:Small ligand-binding sensory domain FIST n=1 Tax=Pseudonocardia sediminis TaxID=1397368 RepID=A0A4Q7UTM1_PSEST|nr:FIST N-terminal domain-containing protein [Pseudonocardia sediminis]RZT84364.1 small ligand-binding sensory domain FIST [Pseudonocardia sediminis]